MQSNREVVKTQKQDKMPRKQDSKRIKTKNWQRLDKRNIDHFQD